MSIWKFRFYLIPEQLLLARYETLPFSIPMELAEEYDWWADVQPPAGFERLIETTLPAMESWSKTLRVWGWKVGGDAQIWYADEDKTKVELIEFRIDSRAVSNELVRVMCALATQLKCVLMTIDYRIVPPDEATVLRVFAESVAANFVVDPVGTLKGLDTNEIKRRIYHITKDRGKQ